MSDLKSKSKLPRWRLFKRSMRVIAPYPLEKCFRKIEQMNEANPLERWRIPADRVEATAQWIDKDYFKVSVKLLKAKKFTIKMSGYCKRWDDKSSLLFIEQRITKIVWLRLFLFPILIQPAVLLVPYITYRSDGALPLALLCLVAVELFILILNIPVALYPYALYLAEGEDLEEIMRHEFGNDDFEQLQAKL